MDGIFLRFRPRFKASVLRYKRLNVFDFFRSAHDDNRARRRHLRRRLGQDLLLYLGNLALWPVERLLVSSSRRQRLPVVFIVGAPRAGTTLLYQLMASYLEIGYVSNLTARFWMAPVTGALLHRILFGRRRSPVPLRSEYGRTRGGASPHEFTWFWKHRIDLAATDDVPDAELERVDTRRLRHELLALAGVFGRPFVWKSVNFADYHVRWLHGLLPDARFVRIRRDVLAVACSVLRARKSQYGDPRKWWSARPRDVGAWRERPWADQIAHQLRDVEEAIGSQTAELPPAAVHTLTYEGLVAEPEAHVRALADFLGVEVRYPDSLRDLELEPGGRRPGDGEETRALEAALEACGPGP